MAEDFQRNKLYEYKANSNLVLEADRENRRRGDEPSGEVETLHGKLLSVRMGDKLVNSDPVKLREQKSKAGKTKRPKEHEELGGNKRKKKELGSKLANVLQEAAGLDDVNYRPKTRETRLAYEELLRLVQTSLGDQPEDIIRGGTDEVLAILKDESLRDPQRQKDIEKIIDRITGDVFSKLVSLGKMITDFNSGALENDGGKIDEEMGVAVIFDDEDNDDDPEDDFDITREDIDEEDEDEDGVEADGHGLLKGEDDMDTEANEAVSEGSLAVHDIDSHWLQRQLSKFYPDANISSHLAEETLQALHIVDDRVCENRLVQLLDYDKFEFVKLLLTNRAKIYYCTKLKQAQGELERQEIEKEMINDSYFDGASILVILNQKSSVEHWTQDRIGEFAAKARKEARALSRRNESDKSGIEPEPVIGVLSELHKAELSSQKLVDLESLQFQQGSHLMGNDRCELPEKSWRAQKKGYEEVHVPAVRPVISSTERLVDVVELPSWAQPTFLGIRSLNRIQSKMVQAALYDSENILLCAPTGAGKTNVALMCMLQQIGLHLRDDGTINLNAFKIVYIAPMKALVQECVQSFGKKLEPLGISVKELSGDQSLSRQQIQETQVIVTTPEKWDIITRKSGDRAYTQLVRLMIIDEIHLLHDERGPVLESLVARTIRQVEATQEMVRLVGLSATLPNFEDVATFLRVNPDKGLFFFDNSFRPVPLQQQFIGITEKKALKRFQLMNEICYEKVLQHAGKHQILIFTHSRAETAKTAKALRDMALENDTIQQFVRDSSASKQILEEEVQSVKSSDLKDLLPFGFAIHHAGMVRSDRTLVEDLYSDKHIQVLVCTATLAWGVNLPAHTVIIKGTQMYSPEDGRWKELSPLDIMQMMGRAGRYGLDSEGEGVIITAHSELQYYLSLMNQQLPIESQFIKSLPDMLNAEIVLGSVQTVKEAASWLGYTYLYVRMLRNPSLYGVEDLERDPSLMRRRIDLAHTAATVLDKHNLIRYNRKTGGFQVTALGRVASHYYVGHESINIFNEHLKPEMSDIEIFRVFSLSGEFQNIHVRDEEKVELMKLANRVPVPVKEGVDEPSAKVNILLQAYISRLKLEGFALVADMTFVQQSACRLMRALFEIALKRSWASLANRALVICKMVEKRIWSSQSPLRQFTGIPDVIIRKLEKNSDVTWERYHDLTPQDLGEMVKMPKMGKILHKYVHNFPKFQLNANVLPITRGLMKIELTITPDFHYDTQILDYSQLFWVLVEDVDGEKILHCEPFILQAQYAHLEHTVNFTVQMQDPMPPQYFLKLVSDRWQHSLSILPISFKSLLMPQKFSPPTDLLDLQPLPVSALGNKQYEKLYAAFKYFNPIQTQTFAALYQNDENVLVCAPTGSGKTVCAELAILKLFESDVNAKCVYIVAKQDIADNCYQYWKDRLPSAIGSVSVCMLIGEPTYDLKLMEKSNVIICTATIWDILSRRWKKRKLVQQISLYVVDEIHLIGGLDGPNLEIVLSRARHMSSHIDKRSRIVALGSSVANAKDLGEWLGVPHQLCFNFTPQVRPTPLELNVHSFEAYHHGSRLLAMARPVFHAVVGNWASKPVLIFVPSSKQAQLTAIDMITFAPSTGNSNIFLNSPPESLESILSRVRDSALSQTLSRGVGFIHSALHSNDRDIVEALYKDNVISVMVCAFDYCWKVNVCAHHVIVMDTVYFEGKEHRFVDYSITDVLQMMGLAGRPLLDDSGVCTILCQTPKKDFLSKILREPLPIESHLHQVLHDLLNSEIVEKGIENKQDAVDYLTWTFFYRRLFHNPNYYGLKGSSHRHLSDHLSELIEKVVNDLEESKCVSVEDDMDLSPLNLGMIASYYYIQYTSVEIFASSIGSKTKVKGLVEILSASSEFTNLSIRQNEETVLKKLAAHLPQALPENANFDESSTKVLVLLQCHFSRSPVGADLLNDLKFVLKDCMKLTQALVDVVSSQGWLRPALACMELSQMIVQGQWGKNSVLFQIPHFDDAIVSKCMKLDPPVESVYDFLELDEEMRSSILSFSPEKLSDIALFCNSYPNIELSFEKDFGDVVESGSSLSLLVVLQRDVDTDEELSGIGKVVSSRFPHNKQEGWWLLLGDPSNGLICSVKRITIDLKNKVKLDFSAPDESGHYQLRLFFVSDSYLGCDQEYDIDLTVANL